MKLSLGLVCTFASLASASAAGTGSGSGALPSLTQWTKQHTNALINAKTVPALHAAADAFLAQNISITSNGFVIPREVFLQTLEVNLPDRIASTVQYVAILESPADPANPAVAGQVGVFLKPKNFYPNGRRLFETSSINVDIVQDPSIPAPPGGGVVDRRRVTVFNSITIIDP